MGLPGWVLGNGVGRRELDDLSQSDLGSCRLCARSDCLGESVDIARCAVVDNGDLAGHAELLGGSLVPTESSGNPCSS